MLTLHDCVFCMLLFNFVNYKLLLLCIVIIIIIIVLYVPFCVFCFHCIFMCKCVLYYCHRLSTQLQLTNLSYHIFKIHFNIILPH